MVSLPLKPLIPLLDSLEEVVWFRRPSGEYLFINKAFERVYGLSRETLAEDPEAWLTKVAPEDRPKLRRIARRSLQAPMDLEWKLRLSDGSSRRVRSLLRPLHGADGSVRAIAGFTENLDRRSTAAQFIEEMSRAQQERDEAVHRGEVYRETLDRIADGFFAVDSEWTLLYVNRRFEQLVGVPCEEAVGRNLWDLFPDAIGSVFEKEYVTALEQNMPREFVAHYPSLSSWYEVRAYPSEHGLSIFFQDVTGRRRLEGELARVASEERKRIGGELHDSVGQKLTGATYMLQALEARLEQGQDIEAADLARIREVLLDTTAATRRISRGLFPSELADQPLGSAFEQLGRDVEEMFGVRCSVDVSPDVALEVERALHLFRITQELVTNAMKHGGASEFSISLAPEKGAVRATIRHDGVDPPAGGDPQGLGLRLVGYRLDLLGGSMTSHRTSGRTCITCRFPLDSPQ